MNNLLNPAGTYLTEGVPRYSKSTGNHREDKMTTATETKRTHLIDCPSCKRTSYCKCNIYHSICAICTFLQQQKLKGIKPIKSTILDRGTGVSRYAKYNEELVRDYQRRNEKPTTKKAALEAYKIQMKANEDMGRLNERPR